MTMQTHPRPSQEIAEAIMTIAERQAALLVVHNCAVLGVSPAEYFDMHPTITRLELRGTGGDKALAQVTQAILARLP
jgi:hypothetical protein